MSGRIGSSAALNLPERGRAERPAPASIEDLAIRKLFRKKTLRIMFSFVLGSFLLGSLAMLTLKWHVHRMAEPHIRQLADVEKADAALVLGAYVYPNGMPCRVLEDRLLTGLELYRSGQVERLILSGDHGQTDYDEVNGMREYLEERGVPKEALFLDHAGFDTYDSLYRTEAIFDVQKLVVVTQEFHLRRALYIASSLGISAQGVKADRGPIPEIKSLETRELAANVKAWLDITRGREPVFLGPKIAADDAAATHDKTR